MFVSGTFLFFLVLLLCAVLAYPLSKKTHVPYPIFLVLIGFAGSEIITKHLGIDTGIHWESFDELIFHGLIPVIIFQAALSLDIKSMRSNLPLILLLAIPFMLLGAGITGALIYFGIAHPGGFPLIAALLVGALLSATDPSAVLSLLKQSGTPDRLRMLLEGESLFNDATAIVLFSVILAIAVSGDSGSITLSAGVLKLGYVFLGGIVLGLVAVVVLCGISGFIVNARLQTLLSVIFAYGVYILAEKFLHLSGVMAVLTTGLVFGNRVNKYAADRSGEIHSVWDFASFVSETLIFLMAGITITLDMFTDQWLAMLIAIAAVVLSRVVIVFVPLALVCRFPGQERLPVKHQVVLVWGGVRGTVTLALALSLPLSLDYWYTIQSMAYGVVIYTLFVQATTIEPVTKLLKIK